MKRRALALLAGILLLGLLPGSASAITPTPLDQSNAMEANHTLGSGNTLDLAQTFQAGKTGMMTEADLWMDGGQSVNLELHDVSGGQPGTNVLASAIATEPGGAGGWTHFVFSNPYGVTAGTEYALVFDTSSAGAVYGSSNTYLNGQAWILSSGSWVSVAAPSFPDRPDWAFRTYVDTVAVDLHWDKAQILGGHGTTLTLTIAATFTYGAQLQSYNMGVVSLPSWFTPTVFTCPASVPLANCNLTALMTTGVTFAPASGYETQTVTMTGTASPAAGDIGTPGVGEAGACMEYRVLTAGQFNPSAGPPNCSIPTASVDVVSVLPSPSLRVTAPPTNAGAEPASSGPDGAVPLLPIALLAFFGGALVMVSRRRRRLIS